MIVIVLMITICLYFLTVGSVRRNDTNYMYMFLFVFFVIVAWSIAVDQLRS